MANHFRRLTSLTQKGGVPSRRFSIGAVDKSRVFVAVEHGGDGYYVEIWSFENNGAHWGGTQRTMSGVLPSSLPELLFVTCIGQQQPAPRKFVPQKPVTVLILADRSIVLLLFNSQQYKGFKLDRNIADRGTPEYNRITDYLHDNGEPSAEERSHLSNTLRAIKRS